MIKESVLQELAQDGYWGMLVPKEYGGQGASSTAVSTMIMKLAQTEATVAGLASIHGCIGAVDPVVTFGNEEQKRRFLPKLASGERLSAFALTEPGAGSDLTAVRTEATLDGDAYVVNGEKLFISNATLGRTIGLVCLIDGKPNVLIVDLPEKENKHFQIKQYGILALRRIHNVGLVFRNFRVPKENVLRVSLTNGEHILGKGLTIAYHGLNRGRIALCANAAGVIRALMADTIPWAQKRVTYKRRIAKRELVQRRIGKMAALTVGCEALTEWCASLLDQGYRGEAECIIAKIFGSEAQKEAAIEYYMKTHGGRSFLEGHAFGDNIHDFLAPCIYEGEGEMLSMAFFKALTKDHAETYLEPMAKAIIRAMQEGKIKHFSQKNPVHAWHIKGPFSKLVVWMGKKYAVHGFRKALELVGLRHPVSGALPAGLKKQANWAVMRLQDKSVEINNMLTKYGAALIDRQCMMVDLSEEVQNLMVIAVTALWAADKTDPTVQQAAEALCLKLREDIERPGRPSTKYNKLITRLGKQIAEEGSSLIDGALTNPVLQDYA